MARARSWAGKLLMSDGRCERSLGNHADQHVGDHVEPWAEVELLEDHGAAASPAAQGLAAKAGDLEPTTGDRTRGRIGQAVDGPQERRLAGPGASQDSDKFPRLEPQRHIVDSDLVAEALADLLQFQHRHSPGLSATVWARRDPSVTAGPQPEATSGGFVPVGGEGRACARHDAGLGLCSVHAHASRHRRPGARPPDPPRRTAALRRPPSCSLAGRGAFGGLAWRRRALQRRMRPASTPVMRCMSPPSSPTTPTRRRVRDLAQAGGARPADCTCIRPGASAQTLVLVEPDRRTDDHRPGWRHARRQADARSVVGSSGDPSRRSLHPLRLSTGAADWAQADLPRAGHRPLAGGTPTTARPTWWWPPPTICRAS